MDKWRYSGIRSLSPPKDSDSFPMHVITVPHPNGEWAAIYCKTKEQAEEIVNLRTELAEAKNQLDKIAGDYTSVEHDLNEDRKRLAVAEGWLDKCTPYITHNPPLFFNVQAFLTAPTSPDHVLVRREDLDLALLAMKSLWDIKDDEPTDSLAYDRLKAALLRKGESMSEDKKPGGRHVR